MSPDEVFRWIFVTILVGFLPFGLYHRIRSNIGGEKLNRWQESTFILFELRLSGLPWFLGGIVWMIDPNRMAWALAVEVGPSAKIENLVGDLLGLLGKSRFTGEVNRFHWLASANSNFCTAVFHRGNGSQNNFTK